MRLPAMKYSGRQKKTTQVRFSGMNHSLGANDGSIWDMTNMTSDHAPLLATRKKRWLYRKLNNPGGLFASGELCWVEDGKFYYGGEEKGAVTEGKKTFATMGSAIVILPDGAAYNTKTDTFFSMGAAWEGSSLTFRNGKLYGEEANANAIYCAGADWGKLFKAGDAVTIGGCTTNPGNNKTIVIREIDGDTLHFYEYSFTLVEEKEYTEEGALSIRRTVPELLFGCENENRLWGCDSETIYASKQGDITNWNVYDQVASDAWAVTPSAPGAFIGGISYRGYPVLFKEERIFKVYGNLPSNYEVIGSATLGLEEGSGQSLAVAGETLFYLSRSGMVAYTGGIPQPVGRAFGTKKFRNAVAGSDGLKYYVSMEDEEGIWGLYVYDTQKRAWHKEDHTHATHFAYHDGNVYCLNDQGEIWILGDAVNVPAGAVEEESIHWDVEFVDFTDGSPDKKGVGKMQIRMSLELGASFEAYMQYDSDGVWHKVENIAGEDPKRSYVMPIVPRRCDHCRLKLLGEGGCTIHSITREIYAGSELKSKQGRN